MADMTPFRLAASIALASSFALVGCEQAGEPEPAEQQAESAATEAGNVLEDAATDAGNAMDEAATEAENAMENAVEEAEEAVEEGTNSTGG
ncbi:MAG: hypothetical protein AAFR96_02085 [Planctomycetota bacterium]